MKYFLQENVKEAIRFKPAGGIHGNLIVVHAHEVKPVDCVIALIIRAGLRDEEITISFSQMIHPKMKAQQTGTIFSLSAENLFEEIFNAVSLSHDPL